VGLLDSPAINVAAAVIGGVAFGWGVGQLVGGITIGAAVWAVVGLVLLWWAFIDRRKWRHGTPESERDGSHTIE
jgi:ABC-type glucose/galactose transport system permease subunit